MSSGFLYVHHHIHCHVNLTDGHVSVHPASPHTLSLSLSFSRVDGVYGARTKTKNQELGSSEVRHHTANIHSTRNTVALLGVKDSECDVTASST